MHTKIPMRRMTARQATKATKALYRAAELGGGWKGLAGLISSHSGKNITPQAVFRWSIIGVPAERAVQVEEVLDGAVLRQELRPDIFDGMREVS